MWTLTLLWNWTQIPWNQINLSSWLNLSLKLFYKLLLTLDVYGLSYAFVLSFCLPKLDASIPFSVICYSQPINYLSLHTAGKGLEMYWLYQFSFNNCCVTIFENSFAKCCERMYNITTTIQNIYRTVVLLICWWKEETHDLVLELSSSEST